MIANAAFLAALVLLVIGFDLAAELAFLAPYKHLLARYVWVIFGAAAVLFVNLFALFYTVARWVFLKDTGRKLAHLERQLGTNDTIARELSERLSRED